MRARLYPITIGSTTIVGVSDIGVDPGHEDTRPLSDGRPEPVFAALAASRPRFTFSTLNVAGALAAIGENGTRQSVDVYDALIGDGVGFQSGGSHVKHSLANAHTVITSINAPGGGGNASLTAVSAGYSSTSTEPYSMTPSSSLPSVASWNTSLFAAGPVKVNGTAITGILNVTINFGIDLVEDMSDSHIWPKDVRIISKVAGVTLETNDPEMIKNAMTNAAGVHRGIKALASAGLEIFLKKRSAVGFVANATAEHIKLTLAVGNAEPGPTSGNPRGSTLVFKPIVGSSAMIQISTTSAIS